MDVQQCLDNVVYTAEAHVCYIANIVQGETCMIKTQQQQTKCSEFATITRFPTTTAAKHHPSCLALVSTARYRHTTSRPSTPSSSCCTNHLMIHKPLDTQTTCCIKHQLHNPFSYAEPSIRDGSYFSGAANPISVKYVAVMLANPALGKSLRNCNPSHPAPPKATGTGASVWEVRARGLPLSPRSGCVFVFFARGCTYIV